MKTFLTVLHVLTCFILIVVVLLQRGKGAEIGAVFGGGASSTVFGARGAGNFLTKLTTAAAVTFMLSSLSLSYLSTQGVTPSLFDEETPAAEGAPAATGEAESPFVEVESAAPAPQTPESAKPEAALDTEASDAAETAP